MQRRAHRLAFVAVIVAYVAAILGGAVTTSDSSLADPHWPSFEGGWLPRVERMLENVGLLFEHGHRILIGVAGLCTLALAVVLWPAGKERPALRRLSLASLVLLALPAVLGGLTVLFQKSTVLSIVHVALAMSFLSVLTSIASLTGPGWRALEPAVPAGQARRVSWLAAAACAAVFIQVILGSVPRHATAEVGGRSLVLLGDGLHIAWAFVVFTTVILVYLETSREPRKLAPLFRPALGLVFLIVLQIFLGFAAFATQPRDPPSAAALAAAAGSGDAPGRSRPDGYHQLSASTHQAAGVLTLLVSLVLALRAGRVRRLCESAAREPATATATAMETAMGTATSPSPSFGELQPPPASSSASAALGGLSP